MFPFRFAAQRASFFYNPYNFSFLSTSFSNFRILLSLKCSTFRDFVCTVIYKTTLSLLGKYSYKNEGGNLLVNAAVKRTF